MYSLDFGTMQQLLFERNWLSYDEKQLNKYLKKNKDLTQLSDEELRSKMLSIKPTNDWERLFSNKNFDDNFEDVIKQIGKLRNCVAHNKLFNKEKYYQLLDLLDNDIDDAILITETEDFKRINNEKFNDSLEQLGKVMSELAKSVSNITKNIIDNCSVGKTLSNLIPKFSLSEIIKENLENTEIRDVNKNILSENSDDDLIE